MFRINRIMCFFFWVKIGAKNKKSFCCFRKIEGNVDALRRSNYESKVNKIKMERIDVT